MTFVQQRQREQEWGVVKADAKPGRRVRIVPREDHKGCQCSDVVECKVVLSRRRSHAGSIIEGVMVAIRSEPGWCMLV